MTTDSPLAPAFDLAAQADVIDSYTLYATQWSADEAPYLELNCPHQHCPGGDENGCASNLIDPDRRTDVASTSLGALIGLAAEHEAARDGYNPPGCQVIDVPDVGPMRIQGELSTTADHQAIGEVVRAAQRKMIHEVNAELLARLDTLRQAWHSRQRADIYTRESADGPIAGIAGARADLYGTLLAELDQAVSGG